MILEEGRVWEINFRQNLSATNYNMFCFCAKQVKGVFLGYFLTKTNLIQGFYIIVEAYIIKRKKKLWRERK